MLVGYDESSEIKVWPLAAGADEALVRLKPLSGVNVARFSPDGARIAYADYTHGRIAVRTLASGEEIVLRGGPKGLSAYDLSFSADGERIAIVGEQSRVVVWRIDRPERPERNLKADRGHVNAMAFAADGRIVTGGADRTVRVFPARGDRALVLRGHTDEVGTVLIDRSGDRVLSASIDGEVRVWDARRGVALAVLRHEQGALYDVVMSRRRTCRHARRVRQRQGVRLPGLREPRRGAGGGAQAQPARAHPRGARALPGRRRLSRSAARPPAAPAHRGAPRGVQPALPAATGAERLRQLACRREGAREEQEFDVARAAADANGPVARHEDPIDGRRVLVRLEEHLGGLVDEEPLAPCQVEIEEDPGPAAVSRPRRGSSP